MVASGPSIYAQDLIHHFLERKEEFPNLVLVHSVSLELSKEVNEVSGSWKERDVVIRKAKRLISRSGYSTLMDSQYLGIEGVFIPTKGQAEQVYLAKRWEKQKE